jgi:DNA ligase (NAD+)
VGLTKGDKGVQGFGQPLLAQARHWPRVGVAAIACGPERGQSPRLPTMARDEAIQIIETAGGIISGSVTKSTNYLVAGIECGSKLEKALAPGVPVLDEAGLLKLIGGGNA